MATPRLGTAANQDNTFRNANFYYEEPAYAATLAITTKDVYKQVYKVAELTGAMTINVTDTSAKVGDELVFIFDEDNNSGGRVVTFGTALLSSGTLTVAQAKRATALFVHDGSDFIEVSRTITA